MSHTQQVARDTLAYIERIVANLNEEESTITALYKIKQDTKRYIAKNNQSLLEMAELGKNQLFYLNILRNYNWITAKDLSQRIKENQHKVTTLLNALEKKGYLQSEVFEGLLYYKVKD